MKEFCQPVSIWQSERQKYSVTFFPDTVYIEHIEDGPKMRLLCLTVYIFKTPELICVIFDQL